jgi:hypothetical protein
MTPRRTGWKSMRKPTKSWSVTGGCRKMCPHFRHRISRSRLWGVPELIHSIM